MAFAILFPDATVIGVVHIKELVDISLVNIKKHHSNLLEVGRIKIFLGDGRKGKKEFAPFDYVHSGAGKQYN